jgi:hypothetical protein
MFGKIGNTEVARKLNTQQQKQTRSRQTVVDKNPSGFLKWCPVFDPKHLIPFFDVST